MQQQVTSREFRRRFRKAVNVPFNLTQICSPTVQQLVNTHSAALGCSPESFFFPLLSCCASCIGPYASLELTPEWHEPPILWTLVISQAPVKRVNVLDRFEESLLQIETETRQQVYEGNVQFQCVPQFLVEFFDMDSLHKVLYGNGGNGIGIYNNVEILKKVISQSAVGAEVITKLYSGSPWIINNSQVGRVSLTKSNFNIACWTHPDTMFKTIFAGDSFANLLYNYFFFVCSEDNQSKFSHMSATLATPNLNRLFKNIYDLHQSAKMIYKLSQEANLRFSQFHDELIEKAKQGTNRQDGIDIYHNTLSSLARLTCVLHVLEAIADSANFEGPVDHLSWNTEIGPNTIWQARQILAYLLEQKKALLEPSLPPEQANRVMTRPPQASGSNGMMNMPNLPPPDSRRLNNAAPVPRNNPPNKVHNTTNNLKLDQQKQQAVTPTRSGLTIVNFGNTAPTSSSVAVSSAPSTPVAHPAFPTNLPPSLSVSVVSDQQSTPVQPMIHSVMSLNPSSLSESTDNYVAPNESDEDFIKNHKANIVKLLTHSDSQLSSAQAVKLKLFPLVQENKNVRYPAKYAIYILRKTASMGFGECSQVSECAYFTKRMFELVTAKARQILSDLGVTEAQYQSSFVPKSDTRPRARSLSSTPVPNGDVVEILD